MKDYFKRLKTHPGLGIASLLTCLGALAGASNTAFQNSLNGMTFGIIVMGIVVWLPVLISNRK